MVMVIGVGFYRERKRLICTVFDGHKTVFAGKVVQLTFHLCSMGQSYDSYHIRQLDD